MPELPSDPPQFVASTSSETGCRVRRASSAHGRSFATSAAARSTVFRTPVGAELVLALELADAEVVRMDVVARLDVLRGKADDLAVAAQGGARQHPSPRDLVAGLDVLAHLDARGAIFQDRARGELLLRDRDVVFGPQHDGSLGQRECRHGVPPAPNYTGLDPWMRRTTVGSISSWMVVWSMPNRAWRTSCSWRSSRSLSPT